MFSHSRKPRRASLKRPAQRQHHSYNFELLEHRRLLTTVSTSAALIAAINVANAAGGNNTITLAKNISLFSADNITNGPNGLPVILSGDNLTINGAGHILQRDTTATDFRFFVVSTGATLTLNKITLKNGLEFDSNSSNAIGGAIDVEANGTLNLNSSTLTGNSVSNLGTATALNLAGGAIFNDGQTNLSHSVVTNNAVRFNFTNAPGAGNNLGTNDANSNDGNETGNGIDTDVLLRGGGIFNDGSLILEFTTISNNTAACTITNGSNNPPSGVGNGSGNGDSNSSTTTNDGHFNGNGVHGDVIVRGGGVENEGSAGIENDAFVGNRAACTVINGSDNGNNNSDNDNGDNNGDDNGNGVVGNITVAGGALYSNDTFETVDTSYIRNSVASSVTNGNNNGDGNGVATENDDGNNNGNGVDGNITLFGGAIANDSGGAANIIHCVIRINSVTSTITNGNNDGDGNGENNAGLGNSEGKNNGNAVAGFVNAFGGAIDNEDTAHTDVVTNCNLTANFIKNTIANGNNTGNADGNNDGDGDALASVDNTIPVLQLLGGGIHNAGNLNVTSTTFLSDSIGSNIRNGNNDGNNCGNNNAENSDGRANGNAVSGGIHFSGGGIENSGALNVSKSTLIADSLYSSIANGSSDGSNDGQNDDAHNNCGINCGDAVFGDVEIDGGGIGNSGVATASSSKIFTNLLFSLVTSGKNDGQNDGTGSTGADGQGDGDALDGNLNLHGGGISSDGLFSPGSDITITANAIRSVPNTGSNDTTLNGKLINGTITISGINKF
jgi:hypothetical protein